MEIVFTKHALGKFQHLSVIKLGIKKKHITLALESPDYSAETGEESVFFVLKKIDNNHDLRVVYRNKNGIIIVVTFHPAKRGRYEKTQN